MKPFQEWSDDDLLEYFYRKENLVSLQQSVQFHFERLDELDALEGSTVESVQEQQDLYNDVVVPRVYSLLDLPQVNVPKLVSYRQSDTFLQRALIGFRSTITAPMHEKEITVFDDMGTWGLVGGCYFMDNLGVAYLCAGGLAAGAITLLRTSTIAHYCKTKKGFVSRYLPDRIFVDRIHDQQLHVLGHELVHALDKNIALPDSAYVREGIAELLGATVSYEEGCSVSEIEYSRLVVASNVFLHRHTPSKEIEKVLEYYRDSVPYSVGFSAVCMLSYEFGPQVLRQLMGYE
jgi:hypothetical protein